MHIRFGIDLGGTKIELAALSPAGDICHRERVATPQGDYVAILDAIAGLVTRAEQTLGTQGSVGVGIPGAESRVNGRIKNANSTCLNGQALRHDLEARLKRPVRLANDANCFALSEATDGAGSGARVVFGVILGTGVGGGIVVDGRLLVGPHAIAGEWGHNPLPDLDPADPGPPRCYCGRYGCIETYLAGPSLTADLKRQGGPTLRPEDIVARAAAGDLACEAALQRHEARLARALSTVINLLDPDVIILGGGLSRIDRLYRNLPALCARHVFSDDFRTRIAPPLHGDASGVRGAAWLWP